MAEKKSGGRASKFAKRLEGGSPQSRAAVEAVEAVEDTHKDAVRQPTSRTTAKKERPQKPVRITVDLDADRHRFLREYAFRQDGKATAVVRALLDELRDDPALSERVIGRLVR